MSYSLIIDYTLRGRIGARWYLLLACFLSLILWTIQLQNVALEKMLRMFTHTRPYIHDTAKEDYPGPLFNALFKAE